MKLVSALWSRRGIALVALVALVAAVAVAPTGLGFSSGAMKSTIQDPNFATNGCTACHGGGAFQAGGMDVIDVDVLGADGAALAGNIYTADAVYTINITLAERNAVDGGSAGNHAGFNLRASSGTLAGVEGVSQADPDGSQATHLDGKRTSWQVQWTAPASGPAVFDLFVNDVDGSGAPDAADAVHRIGWFFTDDAKALPGAVEAHEVHFGISLQQYWIGLIGLAGMIFIMLAGYLYLKFGSPHNTDKKDR